jgi:hypothetical protein
LRTWLDLQFIRPKYAATTGRRPQKGLAPGQAQRQLFLISRPPVLILIAAPNAASSNARTAQSRIRTKRSILNHRTGDGRDRQRQHYFTMPGTSALAWVDRENNRPSKSPLAAFSPTRSYLDIWKAKPSVKRKSRAPVRTRPPPAGRERGSASLSRARRGAKWFVFTVTDAVRFREAS